MPEDGTVMDLVESLLQRSDPERRFLAASDLETAYDAGGTAELSPDGSKRAFSVLTAMAGTSGRASYRIIGKYAAFLLSVEASKGTVFLTAVGAGDGGSICRCSIVRGRDSQGKVAYHLVLESSGTTPFGLVLMDAVLQAAIATGGLAVMAA